MKNIIGMFLLVANSMLIFPQTWTNAVTSLTIGSNQSFTSATDRNGIHILYYYNGTLKYGRINSAGSTIVSDVTVATGIGSYAAITTYNDKIYAVYEKNTDVYIAKSTDGGSNWSAAIGEYSRTNSFGSLSATSDGRGVHVVWSEYGGTNEAFYALAKVGEQNPVWSYLKEVSDYGNDIGLKPSVALSANKVHVTYQQWTGYLKSRDFLISESTPSWEDPVTLQSSPGGYSVDNRTMVIGNNLHVICLEYYSYGMSTYNVVRHYIRNVNSTSYTSATLTDEYYSSSPNFHLVTSQNGDEHLFYNKKVNNTSTHLLFNGTSWSTVANDLVWNNRNHVSSAGNDLFLIQEDMAYSDILSLRQYDATPTIPTSMSFSGSSFLTVNWAYNPEPDIQLYEVWRKYYRNSHDNEDWTLKTTRTTNSWVDLEFEYNGPGNIYTVYYKTKAKDNSNQMSSYSGEISTEAYIIFSKQGNLTAEENTPKEFDLKQNYPNPFNPTTTITFALPEASQTSLSVYDETGRDVAILFDGYLTAGTFTSTFDASKYSSGLYFYKIISGKYSATKKMLLMK